MDRLQVDSVTYVADLSSHGTLRRGCCYTSAGKGCDRCRRKRAHAIMGCCARRGRPERGCGQLHARAASQTAVMAGGSLGLLATNSGGRPCTWYTVRLQGGRATPWYRAVRRALPAPGCRRSARIGERDRGAQAPATHRAERLRSARQPSPLRLSLGLGLLLGEALHGGEAQVLDLAGHIAHLVVGEVLVGVLPGGGDCAG